MTTTDDPSGNIGHASLAPRRAEAALAALWNLERSGWQTGPPTGLCDCEASNWQTETMEQCSIHRPTTRKKESVTELTVNGADIGRYSEHSRYPLPPFPERINVAVDGWNRYKLPSPSTGRLTAYTRATTVASTTPDFYNLNRWKIRTKVAAAVGVLDAAAGRERPGHRLRDTAA